MYGSCFYEITNNFGERCRVVGYLRAYGRFIALQLVTLQSFELQMASSACFHHLWLSYTHTGGSSILCPSLRLPQIHSRFFMYQCPTSIKKSQESALMWLKKA